MVLLFKQRLFSLLSSYDIFNINNETVYTVKSKFSFVQNFEIFDASGAKVAYMERRLFTFLPKYDLYLGDEYIGCIKKEFSFMRPKFTIDCKGWYIEGSIWERYYSIYDSDGYNVATITKKLLNFTDTYSLNIADPFDALPVLMLVIAIDGEKATRD